jgi:hypothetical protein
MGKMRTVEVEGGEINLHGTGSTCALRAQLKVEG